MRRSNRRLPIVYADDALREIDEIADWNEKTYNRTHAREYVRFLVSHIDKLAKDFEKGTRVSMRPDLRYIRIQKRSKAYGHVAVYVFDDRAVTIIHVFHSSQDWERRLEEEQK